MIGEFLGRRKTVTLVTVLAIMIAGAVLLGLQVHPAFEEDLHTYNRNLPVKAGSYLFATATLAACALLIVLELIRRRRQPPRHPWQR